MKPLKSLRTTDSANPGWLRRLVRCHGHILKIVIAKGLASGRECSDANLALEQSDYFPACNSIPNLFPMMGSLAMASPSQPRKAHKKIPAWSCAYTFRSYQECNHPENDADACVTQSTHSEHCPMNPSNSKSPCAVSKTTNRRGRAMKLRLLLILAAGVYLPVYPLWWISKTTLQPPMILLLATQGWITLSVSLLALSYFGDTRMTPNVES
jgi:hypothetical protein